MHRNINKNEFIKYKKMEENYKEELNINKLINFLHKYNYNYKTINIDITNKTDNYVILEINVINNDENNIIKKRYKKYIKKYNRKKPISENSLTNLKYIKSQDCKINSKSNSKIETDIENLKISSSDISRNIEDNKITDLINFDKNYINIAKKKILYLQEKIVNDHELDIYNLNNIIKKIKEVINLKKLSIINGIIWKPKDVNYLLQILLSNINTILTEYRFSLLNNKKNRYKDYLFIIKSDT